MSNLNGLTLVVAAVILVIGILFVLSIVSIARANAGGIEKIVWAVVVVAFPVLGPIVWFAVGRRSAEKAAIAEARGIPRPNAPRPPRPED